MWILIIMITFISSPNSLVIKTPVTVLDGKYKTEHECLVQGEKYHSDKEHQIYFDCEHLDYGVSNKLGGWT